MREGYFLVYSSDGDEVHVDLISKEHYDRIKAVYDNWKSYKDDEALGEVAWGTEPIETWFTQTRCAEPWPYNDVKVLGTVSVCCC